MPSRTKIASLVTVLALGALAAVAFASGSGASEQTAGQPAAQATPEVRTEVIRQTVHRRAKGRSGRGSGSAAAATSSGSGGPAPAAAAPAPAAAPPAARSVAAPVARTDDHGRRHGGRGEDDEGFDDHGDDDDAFDDHGGDDDGGHGRGRGRGRGGDDD